MVVCSNYVLTIKQNLKDYYSQHHSPLPPPPITDKKPALPSEWSFSDTDRIDVDEIDNILIESPKINNKKMKDLLIKSRPPLQHEAFNLDMYKRPTNTKIKRHVDEMVKNGTPYLAMSLCPVYKLELSKNLMLSEETKSKFPFLERMDEIFNDGIVYNEKHQSFEGEENKKKTINIKNLMDMINRLEVDENDDIENIISEYI